MIDTKQLRLSAMHQCNPASLNLIVRAQWQLIPIISPDETGHSLIPKTLRSLFASVSFREIALC